MKPYYVVETGVASGLSSTMILQALEDNLHGQLFSIDLPNYQWITDNGKSHLDAILMGREPGWAMPKFLRGSRHLVLGYVKDFAESK